MKTKWKISPMSKEKVHTDEGILVCTAMTPGRAEEIVRDHNTAEEMRKTLKDALSFCQLIGTGQETPFSAAEMCDLLGAAIAHAEVKE